MTEGKPRRGWTTCLRLRLVATVLALCVPIATAAHSMAGLSDLDSTLLMVSSLDLDEGKSNLFEGGSLKTDPSDESRIRIIASALSWLGVPYSFGGFSDSGVDCSGFLNRTISQSYPFLNNIPRRSDEFSGFGEPVDDIEPGDILLFSSEGSIYHVGLALSSTTFIHSASEGVRTGVIISSIWDGNWRSRLSGVRRIVAGATPQ